MPNDPNPSATLRTRDEPTVNALESTSEPGPNVTLLTRDVTTSVALYGGAGSDPSARPWGSPGNVNLDVARNRKEVASALLDHLGKLLDVLQPAHRAGALTPEDIRQMQQIELWYASLQVDIEHIQVATAGATAV